MIDLDGNGLGNEALMVGLKPPPSVPTLCQSGWTMICASPSLALQRAWVTVTAGGDDSTAHVRAAPRTLYVDQAQEVVFDAATCSMQMATTRSNRC